MRICTEIVLWQRYQIYVMARGRIARVERRGDGYSECPFALLDICPKYTIEIIYADLPSPKWEPTGCFAKGRVRVVAPPAKHGVLLEIAKSFFTEVIVNTKILMTISSLLLALAGIFALFAPDVLLALLGVPMANPLSVLIQLMGALYFSMALMNWTAKDSAIGGIYARPVSLANFAHFFSGALLLAKHVLSNGFNGSILWMLIVYAIFASVFYWLVFRATGIKMDKNTQR